MNTPRNDPRSAGAQSLKRMFIALRDAENAAFDDIEDGMPDPTQFTSIIEAAFEEATSSGVVGFRGGFFTALAEWLLPTVSGSVVDDPERWEPLAEEGQSKGAGGSAGLHIFRITTCHAMNFRANS